MFSKVLSAVMSALKSPVFWAGFATGALATAAFPKLRNAVKPVASKIPGASAE